MTGQELKIGNLVNSDVYGDFEIVGLSIFNNGNEIVWKSMEYYPKSCRAIDLKPIELTEGWLKKSELRKDGIMYEKGMFAIKAYKVGGEIEWILFWGNQMIFTKKKYYVHHLQNLYFALIGEELTIKL